MLKKFFFQKSPKISTFFNFKIKKNFFQKIVQNFKIFRQNNIGGFFFEPPMFDVETLEVKKPPMLKKIFFKKHPKF
ncbi:MAG: hypothetical protein B6I24_01700 [Bacteroidetes bacterium 4572_128]|nr:MAG: hypothetical protein B6I24_01700 [Bacteroidetes bacterium 4572_128]